MIHFGEMCVPGGIETVNKNNCIGLANRSLESFSFSFYVDQRDYVYYNSYP